MDSKPRFAGVYSITHISSGKRYVGSSGNIHERWYSHRGSLRRGNHYCVYLQRSWSKYGESEFEFEVLEQCLNEETILLAREQCWIDKYSKKLFNARRFSEPCCREWMETEDGLLFRKRIGEATSARLLSLPYREMTCDCCGNQYQTRVVSSKSRFCSDSCARKQRIEDGKHDIEATCEACGRCFTTKKYEGVRFCSRECWKPKVYSLAPEDIPMIFGMAAKGESYNAIGAKFKVSSFAISQALKRNTWPEVAVDPTDETLVRERLSTRNWFQKTKYGRLTDEQVVSIRQRLDSGEKTADLARELGVSFGSIADIRYRRTYKDI